MMKKAKNKKVSEKGYNEKNFKEAASRKKRQKTEKRPKKGRKAIKKIGAIFILFGNLSNYFQKVGKVVVKEIVWNGIKICV
jgi:hypothetical protein